jgi:hypothetical protein
MFSFVGDRGRGLRPKPLLKTPDKDGDGSALPGW